MTERLILTRATAILLGSKPRARLCTLSLGNRTWFAIENGDDPDKLPVGEYDLIMTRMWTSKREALWLEGTELFVHGVASPGQVFTRALKAGWLKGCTGPVMEVDTDGVGYEPDSAMEHILHALGGFEEGRRVPFKCVELVEAA